MYCQKVSSCTKTKLNFNVEALLHVDDLKWSDVVSADQSKKGFQITVASDRSKFRNVIKPRIKDTMNELEPAACGKRNISDS